jgi:hypothetical protein
MEIAMRRSVVVALWYMHAVTPLGVCADEIPVTKVAEDQADAQMPFSKLGILGLGQKHWFLSSGTHNCRIRLELKGLTYGFMLHGDHGEQSVKICGHVGVGTLFSRRGIQRVYMRASAITFVRVDITSADSGVSLSGEVIRRVGSRHSAGNKRIVGLYSFSLRGRYKF